MLPVGKRRFLQYGPNEEFLEQPFAAAYHPLIVRIPSEATGMTRTKRRKSVASAGCAWIASGYVDATGVERVAPAAAVRALSEAIGEINTAEAVPGIVIAGRRTFGLGRPPGFSPRCVGMLEFEEGGTLDVRASATRDPRHLTITAAAAVPLGIHRLTLACGRRSATTFVLARPRSLAGVTAALGRRVAVFLPLYAAASDGLFGVGTYRNLRELSRWAASLSGSIVGTLPLFPVFLDRPFDPCPYAPISRLMWNELFIEPREAPEWGAHGVQGVVNSGEFRRQAERARTGRLVDYRLSWRLARRVLKAMASVARASPRRWSEIAARCTSETSRYALFRARDDATGRGWDAWPAPWREGRLDASGIDPADVDLYMYAQTTASAQMSAVRNNRRRSSLLYLDLPIGVHAHGFDPYARPDLFLHGVSAGVPPDALNSTGQLWGFPPMHPTAGRADGYAHLRAILRPLCAVAGVLRIDHVMGLYRMYCVPAGHDGSQGAYIRYPEQELFAIVLIEAARAGTLVVGEDLGVVPAEVRTLMRSFGMLGMHVQQFALSGEGQRVIRPAGPGALASLNTHDTPTFAGFWHADDLSLRRKLGHIDAAGARRERSDRRSMRGLVCTALKKRGLSHGNARDVAMSLMREQARGRAPIVLVNLEDLWGERWPQNVPGTATEYPNWRRRASKPLRKIMRDRRIAASLMLLMRERRRRSKRRAR